MSNEDYQKGLHGTGSGSGMDYQKGVYERERQRQESRAPVSAGAGHTTSPASSGATWDSGQTSGPGRRTTSVPETMGSMAKGGAGLAAVVFVGYTLLQNAGWTWPQMAGGGIAAAIVGAIGGAALYIALKVLEFAFKVIGVLLVIAVVLHFLGVVNVGPWFTAIRRAIGL